MIWFLFVYCLALSYLIDQEMSHTYRLSCCVYCQLVVVVKCQFVLSALFSKCDCWYHFLLKWIFDNWICLEQCMFLRLPMSSSFSDGRTKSLKERNGLVQHGACWCHGPETGHATPPGDWGCYGAATHARSRNGHGIRIATWFWRIRWRGHVKRTWQGSRRSSDAITCSTG